MAEREPVAARALDAGDRPGPTWPEARERLANADEYWLATVRPDGRPHVVPVLAVWRDGALYVVAGETTRKARNLAADPRCVVTTRSPGVDLVVEGVAAKVRDEATLHEVAAAYAQKYGWHVAVRDGAFHDEEGAPTAGPPPYDLYAVAPSTVFAFGTDDRIGATRWRF